MGIEIAIAAACAAASSAYASNAAQSMGETHSDPILAKRRATAHKCESCGSRDFLRHNSVLTCTYCRSEVWD